MPLTKRQKEILDYIGSYIEERCYAPSFEEIAESFGYSSLATVHEHLSNLERKGYIRKAYNESRSVELVPPDRGQPAVELPLLGAVAAGLPIEAIPDDQTLAVPPDMVSRRRDNYVLRVEGNSMIEDSIRDAFHNVGSAIVVNTIILAAGFFVMTTSAFKMNVDLGLMTILAILFALVLDFLLLPALLLLGKREQQQATESTAQLPAPAA